MDKKIEQQGLFRAKSINKNVFINFNKNAIIPKNKNLEVVRNNAKIDKSNN